MDSDVAPKSIPYIQGLLESIKRVLSELDIVVGFYPMHDTLICHLLVPQQKVMGRRNPKLWVKITATLITHV